MSKIFEITVKVITPFNISTGNKSNGFIKNLTIKDIQGKPYIPGSSIKGLIRDNYMILEENSEEVFGKAGYFPSKIIVDNLTITDEDSSSQIRFGNAINRCLKVANENALYSKEVVSGTFKGNISIEDDDLELIDNIRAAVKMISSIGGSKSTGFGQVEADMTEVEIQKNTILEGNKIILEFESPVVIGGKKKNSNFMESDDVIKGSVIRAAFAKKILADCPFRNQEYTDISGKIRKNWIAYRNDGDCGECKYKSICKKFSDIKFSYFYPLGTECIPLTAKVCKEDKDHGFYDVLLDKKECAKCNNTRLDFTTGLRTKNKINDSKKCYDVTKTVVTKNAINPYTKTAEDGMLYSIEAVSSTHIDSDGKVKCIYEGTINNIEDKELKLFSDLRVGGDTTVGFGKCKLKKIAIKEPKAISLADIKKFSAEYKKVLEKRKQKLSESYISIKFNSDSKLDFNFKKGYISTDKLKEKWKEALFNNVKFDVKDIKINSVYTEFINYRGYDNSVLNDDKREKVDRLVSKGTVIVFESNHKIEDLYNLFSNIDGFGKEQENGFGNFQIYLGGLEDER